MNFPRNIYCTDEIELYFHVLAVKGDKCSGREIRKDPLTLYCPNMTGQKEESVSQVDPARLSGLLLISYQQFPIYSTQTSNSDKKPWMTRDITTSPRVQNELANGKRTIFLSLNNSESHAKST